MIVVDHQKHERSCVWKGDRPAGSAARGAVDRGLSSAAVARGSVKRGARLAAARPGPGSSPAPMPGVQEGRELLHVGPF